MFSMKKLIREIPLANGLIVQFFDATRRYFGDYHKVRVTISCEVPLSSGLFDDEKSYEAALKLLGPKVRYLKEIEHQGVATDATAETIEKVITDFVAHSLTYFNSEAFPKKLVLSELNRRRSRSGLFIPMHSNG
jgi:hypothetical protein